MPQRYLLFCYYCIIGHHCSHNWAKSSLFTAPKWAGCSLYGRGQFLPCTFQAHFELSNAPGTWLHLQGAEGECWARSQWCLYVSCVAAIMHSLSQSWDKGFANMDNSSTCDLHKSNQVEATNEGRGRSIWSQPLWQRDCTSDLHGFHESAFNRVEVPSRCFHLPLRIINVGKDP